MFKFKLKWSNFFFLTIAGIINAIGVGIFLIPVSILDGGLSGTSFFLSSLTKGTLNTSVFLLILNFPFFIFGIKKIGKNFLIYSLYAILIYSIFLFIIQKYILKKSTISPIIKEDRLLGAIFGGLFSGIGTGTVIRFGGTLDGIEVLAVVVAKKIGLTVGKFVMIYNIIIYSISAIVNKSWQISLYSIITYSVGLKAVDFIVEGLDKGKSIVIITDKCEEMAKTLSEELGRGITILDAHGYYSNIKKSMIYCVVNRFEITRLKKIIKIVDEKSFITISEVSEIYGRNKIEFRNKNNKKI